ncbi:MAG TPA: DUF4129 domain-containing protein [Nitrososphaerales archaeon]|nr:DUF4129 domain-containing protein [Nitrososphaerales archaeon]
MAPSKSSTKTILAAGVVVFLFLATTLSDNIAEFRSLLATPTPAQGSGGGNAIVASNLPSSPVIPSWNGNPQNTFLILSIAMIALVLFSVVLYLTSDRSGEDEYISKKGFPERKLAQILAMAFLILFLVGLIEGLRAISQFSASPNSAPNLGSLDGAELYSAIIVITAGSLFGLFFLLRPHAKLLRKNQKVVLVATSQEEKVKELRAIFERTAHSIGQGEDPRSTIIRCYDAVVLLLEKNGLLQRPSLTPREFVLEISSRIGLSPSKYLHEVTLLFERARYSAEELSLKEASDAKFCLEQLSLELLSARNEAMESLSK